MKISICICCYNEEENIELMYKAVTEQMLLVPQHSYEIIFEDNDSHDSSQEILRRIASEDNRVKIILNQTNFGADRSSVNCYGSASGDAVICLPCDFQEPPEMIPDFIKGWEEGFDIVWGQKNRSKENPIKYFCRRIFYSIIKKMSDYPQIEQVTGFGLMDRKVLNAVLVTQIQDPYYHIRNLVCEFGFKIKLLPYTQAERKRGKSSYGISSYYSFAITSLVNTSIKPLRIMTICGIFLSVICFIIALVYFIYKLTHWASFTAGVAPLVIGLFFIAGVQLFCLGLIGEYIGVLIRRTTKRNLVIEKERINFDENE